MAGPVLRGGKPPQDDRGVVRLRGRWRGPLGLQRVRGARRDPGGPLPAQLPPRGPQLLAETHPAAGSAGAAGEGDGGSQVRTPPTDSWEYDEVTRMGAPDWMISTLSLNPDYVFWGPYEDYMCDKDKGWRSPFFCETWNDRPTLDDLNEVANFYFEVGRDAERCAVCDGTGYNPATKMISDDWYDFNNTGRRWDKDLHQEEVDALVKAGRLMDFTHTWDTKKGWRKKKPAFRPTADEVNAWARGRGLGHDAINRGICIEARAKRLGVWGMCDDCKGHGDVFTAPKCRLALVLWLLHPRKGASRGCEIRNIQQTELPAVFTFLREAAARNADRFSKVPR